MLIVINTWIAEKDLMEHHYQMKKLSTATYAHTQKVWDVFEIRNLLTWNLKPMGYHDLFVLSDTLLLADVFENFIKKCIEIYALDPTHFFACTRISVASVFKKVWRRIRVINQ